MSVKTIFKVLIGTIVIIVLSSLTIEIFNISTTGLQVNQISRLSAKQAATLFSQETYKQTGGDGGAVNADNIRDSDGALYITGEFYDYDNATDIYNSMYTSNEFKNWMKSSEATKGNWYNLKLIDRALNNPGSLNVPFGSDGYEEAILAQKYKESMMTPSNLGIPYLDKAVLERMFQWNLAQLMSNTNPDNIKRDDNGVSYVAYKGFRIYANLATISRLEYKTFDLKNPGERVEFNRVTNIDPDNINFHFDDRLSYVQGLGEEERNKVCIVGIEYDIPVAYEGITPIKNIFNFVVSNEVEGINSGSGRAAYNEWLDNTQKLQSGGLRGNDVEGVLPIPGKLIYYIIK